MKKYLIIFICCAAFSSIVSAKEYSEIEKYELNNLAYFNSNNSVRIKKDDIKKYIVNENFDAIEFLMKKAKDDFNGDVVFEWEFLKVYEDVDCLLDIPYDEAIRHLNQWVSKKGSPASYAARGIYFHNIASRYRGEQYIGKVEKKNLENANKYWDLALSDLEKAVDKDKSLIPAFSSIIKIKASQGKSLSDTVSKALNANPQSFYIRQSYIEFLQPKWGYSYEDAQKFIDGSQIYAEKNHRIWGLRGYVYAEKGYSCILDKKYDCAIDNYSNAVKFGIKSVWLSSLAYSYYMKGDYNSSLKTIKIINTYKPDNKDCNYLIKVLSEIENKKNIPYYLNKNQQDIENLPRLGWSDFNKDW